HYLAFVLPAGSGDKIGMVDLGEAKVIEQTAADLKKAVQDAKDLSGAQTGALSKKLYELIFARIKGELGAAKEIFISPDGQLSLIPFEILLSPDGRYLIEDYTFNYLASGRDVLAFGQIKEQAGHSLLVGDPDFNLSGDQNPKPSETSDISRGRFQVARRSMATRGLSFDPLPGARAEVQAIRQVLKETDAEVYVGAEALEQVLTRKMAPRLVHLATHGFFLNDQAITELTSAQGQELDIYRNAPLGQRPIPGAKWENPLLRSGLALAGANSALKSDAPEKTDGLLTAEKVLGLRLRGTDLVVLSACETGLGEVKIGEGVYGLRRAFIQAGTKGLVMSMWSVPDRETKEMMVELYKNLSSGKMNRAEALRQAALQQKKVARQRYGGANPLFWGAFVFLGEP
ncbi:MAG: CHAT domain-containing protein, partial [Deltaproteobacteria bacterium]|nr:CHAT domain-containing protein [Deltaproteobacteria bacterium]